MVADQERTMTIKVKIKPSDFNKKSDPLAKSCGRIARSIVRGK
jgi:hypothetical protein